MKDCARECYFAKKVCTNTECRLNIEYEEDLNCTLIAVRAKQIVDATLLKLKKTLLRENTI